MSETLILADGTKIDKATGEVIREKAEAAELLDVDQGVDNPVGEPAEGEVEEIKQRIPSNRHTNDLPGDVNSTRAIGVIAALTLFGINEREVAFICNTEVENVSNIKTSQRYNDFVTGIIDNVMQAQSDNVRAMFINNARIAATNIISGLKSKNDEIKYSSSKEVLDRGGFRPADVVEHRVRHENELKIIHISGDQDKSVTIETDYADTSR